MAAASASGPSKAKIADWCSGSAAGPAGAGGVVTASRLGARAVRAQGQSRRIGPVLEPLDDVVARLGRWSAGRGSLHALLAARLRRMIDDGELAPGAALPADRALARALAVGRGTVVAAYDLLGQDGRIVRRQGSGTRVAPAGSPPGAPGDPAEPLFLHLLEPPDGAIQLTCAAPPELPPALVRAHQRVLAAAAGDPSARTAPDLGYHPAGHPALRRVL